MLGAAVVCRVVSLGLTDHMVLDFFAERWATSPLRSQIVGYAICCPTTH
jgi:hypothetical protein